MLYLVQLLLHKPEILFLDEPTIGLDAISKQLVRDFIKRINKEKKTTIILTTHDMSDIDALAKRIILIGKGKVLYDGSLKKLKETFANNMHSSCGLYFMDLDFGKEVTREDFKHRYNEKEKRLYLGNSAHDLQHGAYVAGTDWDMYNVPTDTLLWGNMQSEDYYLKYKDEVKEWLKVKPEYDCYEFSQDDLCILHLRCTDYMDSR